MGMAHANVQKIPKSGIVGYDHRIRMGFSVILNTHLQLKMV